MNSQRYPFQHEFDREYDAKREIGPVQRGFERFVLVQVNVFEAQRYARREYQHQYKPFEYRSVYYD